jgi:regulator of replication initiation timing
MSQTQKPPPPTTRHQLVERITELNETVRRQRTRIEDLEADRNRLRRENQSLRRRLTHARLLESVLEMARSSEEESEPTPESVRSARRLYHALPDTCSFPTFFRIADRQDLSVDEARRCLRHFLTRGLLVQEGTRVSKGDRAPNDP